MSEPALAVDVDAPPAVEPRRVVVQVPAIDEPAAAFRGVLDGIANQAAVDGHAIEREAWVTPTGEADETLAVATDHDGFEAIEAPAGKLSARNAAHDAAVAAGADVIVNWDADAAPAHRRVLAALLDPFENPDVVATYGAPRAPWSNPVNAAINAAYVVEDYARPHVNTQLSALTPYAWDEWGGFDESIDQRNLQAVRRHEEFQLHRALEGLGTVERVGHATVIEEPRRPMHRLDRAMHNATAGRYPLDRWGARRGVVSFQESGEK